jgi:LysR family glycine cleavage system transcriptional activator
MENPMSTPALPALAALQCFEAAARLGSFSKAASERHLTHSAISRSVRAVEHWCGETLFERRGPKVILNEAGQRLRERIGEPLLALHIALKLDALPGAPRALRVLVLASIAATWLIPRLPDFADAHPLVTLSVDTAYDMVSLPPLVPAVAIRFGHFDRTGLRCQRLWAEHMVAVATPAWLARHGAAPARWPPGQMLRHTHQPWPARLPAAAGAPRALPEPAGYEFNDALLLVQAAAQGCGVAWVRASLAADPVAHGALVSLAQEPQASDKAVWLVCREELADVAQVRAFFLWAARQR